MVNTCKQTQLLPSGCGVQQSTVPANVYGRIPETIHLVCIQFRGYSTTEIFSQNQSQERIRCYKNCFILTCILNNQIHEKTYKNTHICELLCGKCVPNEPILNVFTVAVFKHLKSAPKMHPLIPALSYENGDMWHDNFFYFLSGVCILIIHEKYWINFHPAMHLQILSAKYGLFLYVSMFWITHITSDMPLGKVPHRTRRCKW